jgi:hypothetical protein
MSAYVPGRSAQVELYTLLLGAVIRKVDAELAVHDFVVIEVSNC